MTLNDQQLQAVNTDGKRVLVLAGPGSGKTRVIVERVARLVTKCGYSGHDILLLTFTRKAAQEMRDRLTERVGEQHVRKMTIGTFHSVCLLIIKQYGELLGYRPSTLSVYDPIDQRDIIDDVVAGRSAKIKQTSMDELLEAFATRGWSVVHEYERTHTQECKVFAEYRARLRENNAVDYGLILADVQRLIETHPDVRAELKARWKHVLIDEYQDTDRLQYNIHTLLDPDNLFAVGDSDQAIYGFRGATVEVINSFATEYFDGEVIELPVCYRCALDIVDKANRLIAHNTVRYDKSIVAARAAFGAVSAKTSENPDAEAAYVLALIRERTDNNSFAVLSRTKRGLDRVADMLDESFVSYIRCGTVSDFWSGAAAKKFLAWLQLVINRRDNLAFMRIRRSVGVADDAYASVRVRAVSEECGHVEALEGMSGHKLFTNGTEEECGDDLGKWVPYMLGRMAGCLDAETGAAIADATEKWMAANSHSLAAFLLWVQQRDIQDDAAEATDGAVMLMTVHAAKGLEFDTVAVVGMHEGHVPHSRATKPEEVEEERRLLYVAITRAQNRLLLTHSNVVEDWGGRPKSAKPSRFIAEMMEVGK